MNRKLPTIVNSTRAAVPFLAAYVVLICATKASFGQSLTQPFTGTVYISSGGPDLFATPTGVQVSGTFTVSAGKLGTPSILGPVEGYNTWSQKLPNGIPQNNLDVLSATSTAGSFSASNLQSVILAPTYQDLQWGGGPLTLGPQGGLGILCSPGSPNLPIDLTAFPLSIPPGCTAQVDFNLNLNQYFIEINLTSIGNQEVGLPSINPGGIVPIDSSSGIIQSGSWFSIYGTNLAQSTTSWNGDFPTSLGGTNVSVNGKPAYIWFVSPTQINAQAPDDGASGNVVVTVTTAGGDASSTVTLGPYAPWLSLFNAKYPAAIVITPGSLGNSGSGFDYIGPSNAFTFPTRPVKSGEVLILYGGGFGPTIPAVPAGQVFSGAAPSVTLPLVTIGGIPAEVNFAGLVEAGLYQLNVEVPDVGSGDQALQVSIGGLSSQGNVFINVQ